MRPRCSIMFVLVACFLMGWVRSQEGSASQRSRRLHVRRRVLERLAERGLSEAEREIVAEEILTRLDTHSDHSIHHSSSTHPPTPPPQHHFDNDNDNQHIRLPASLEVAASSLIDERPSFQDILRQIGPFPDLEDLRVLEEEQELEELEEEIEEIQEEEEEEEEEGWRQREEMTRVILDQYLFHGVQLRELMRNKRGEKTDAATSSSSQSQERRNRRRGRKNRLHRDKETIRENIRNTRKSRKKKLAREVRRMIKAGNITLHEEEESGERYIDCCPSRDEYVNVTIGKTDKNRAVEIHPGYPYFRERVCLPQFENEKCIFPARSLRPGVVTRCTQQYAYSQALSRMYLTPGDWKIHFIKLKSGCSCQVAINHKKKKRRKRKR